MSQDYRDLAAQLCASLFSGGEIEHARAHRITAPFVVEPHEHPDLVQFDWIADCRGSATVDGVATRLEGCTFLLVAPRRLHSMTLEAVGDAARVYHVRVALPATARRAFRHASAVVTSLAANPSLEAALNDVWRLTVGAPGRSLLRLARLAEAIAMWPGAGDAPTAGGAKPAASAGLDRDLDAALKLMEQSLLAPPTLDDLASAAHLSVRHFTRRFRVAFGIAPMEFLDRKRLALAQQMLAYEASSVGEVADRMGFSSLATFSRWFSHLAGESPSEYRSRPHML